MGRNVDDALDGDADEELNEANASNAPLMIRVLARMLVIVIVIVDGGKLSRVNASDSGSEDDSRRDASSSSSSQLSLQLVHRDHVA